MSVNDLKDETKFNKRIISRQYREFAKIYHPDRDGGSESKFREIHTYYGILLAVLENNNKNEDIKKKGIELIKAIALPSFLGINESQSQESIEMF